MMEMIEWGRLQEALRNFAKERGWGRFHTPKNLSTALVVEAAELAEIFQWDTGPESTKPPASDMEHIADEIADVVIYVARIADVLGVDIATAVAAKMAKNADKYPVYQERLF